MRIKEKFNRKLLVEGNDDQHVIWALCERFNILESFDVIDCGGVSTLYEQIPVRFKQSGIEVIGVILDADNHLANRWTELKDIVNKLGFNCPDNIPQEGLIIVNQDNTKLGVWIMPNNDVNGMLEDFISFLIPENDSILPLVEATLEDIERQNYNRYAIIHKSKAKIHSWLALQEDPGTPMGLSITKRYLSTEDELCLKFVEWLNTLFN